MNLVNYSRNLISWKVDEDCSFWEESSKSNISKVSKSVNLQFTVTPVTSKTHIHDGILLFLKDASLDKKTSITLNTQSNDLAVDSTVMSTPVCHISNINGEQSHLEKSSSANLLNVANDDDLIRLEQAATKAQAAFRGYLVRLMHITRTLQEIAIYFTPLTNIGAFKPSCNISVTFNDVKTHKQVPLKKENGQISMVPLFQSQECIAGVISVDPMQGKKVEHNGIKIELLCQIDQCVNI
ncbi:uncharacterized protein LOC111920750 isoform X2 [Lactuca sativa]|uniref:uncharacterized protein LOC111920750 isoform X2 n=1 Tax=Lactuca sativa TaxID=4236 RepID=UPI0022AEF27C|nr:uncharacterized protein LOC111920750 isoform X2 [Lactuca sativa]